MHSVLSLKLFTVVLAFVAVSTGQILPTTSSSTFPGCAVSCALLLQAQSLCTPPNAAVSSNFNYENCFCQINILQPLYSTPDSVCAAECTIEADRGELQTWFTSFCKQVGSGVDPLVATATTLTTSTTGPATITVTTDAAGATVTGSGSGSSATPSTGQSWLKTHWHWVLALGILFFGLLGLAFLAVWIKRRHRRKVSEKQAAASGFPTASEKKRDGARSATPDLWGPHQFMAASGGFRYHNEPGPAPGQKGAPGSARQGHRPRREKSSKGKERDVIEEAEQEPSRPSSRRKKSKTRTDDTGAESQGTGRSKSQRRRDRERDREREKDKGKAVEDQT